MWKYSISKLGFFILVFALVSCQLPSKIQNTPLSISETPIPDSLEIRPTQTPTNTLLKALTLTPTPKLLLTPTPFSQSLPVLDPIEIFDFDRNMSQVEGLIIFQSNSQSPFTNATVNELAASFNQKFRPVEWDGNFPYTPQLWGVSPDGLHAGPLSLPVTDFAGYFPSTSSEMPRFVSKYLSIQSDSFIPLSLPSECDVDPVNGQGQLHCNNFKFSQDGKYLAFFYGPLSCLRGIIVMNTETGDELYRSDIGKGHSYEFLDNGYALIATGYCEGGKMFLVNLQTGGESALDEEGQILWNTQKTAFVVSNSGYYINSRLWGYSTLTNQKTFSTEWNDGVSGHPNWVPSGTHLLYEQRLEIKRDDEKGTANFAENQIVKVDMETGKKEILISESGYDFYLCSDYSVPCEWSGDWVKIRKAVYPLKDVAISQTDVGSDEAQCILYYGCMPVEWMGLNWVTGETIPWSQLPAPTVAVTPSLTIRPDTSSHPIYQHPSKEYAFYTGTDGKSLWLVPQQGDPQLWIQDGQNFHYISQLTFISAATPTPSPESTPLAITWSPDGQFIVSGTNRGVTFFDSKTLTEIRSIDMGHEVKRVIFSPDGTLFATTQASDHYEDIIHVWNYLDGTLLHTLKVTSTIRTDIVFSQSDAIIAVGCSDNKIYIWNVNTGELLQTLDDTQQSGMLLNITLLPDGKTLQAFKEGDLLSTNNAFFFWQVTDGKLLSKESAIDGWFNNAVFSSQTSLMAFQDFIAGKDSGGGVIKIWQATNPSQTRVVETSQVVPLFIFSPDGKMIAVTDYGNVNLWDTQNAELLQSFKMQQENHIIISLAFSPDNKRLATVSDVGKIQIWAIKDGMLILEH